MKYSNTLIGRNILAFSGGVFLLCNSNIPNENLNTENYVEKTIVRPNFNSEHLYNFIDDKVYGVLYNAEGYTENTEVSLLKSMIEDEFRLKLGRHYKFEDDTGYKPLIFFYLIDRDNNCDFIVDTEIEINDRFEDFFKKSRYFEAVYLA